MIYRPILGQKIQSPDYQFLDASQISALVNQLLHEILLMVKSRYVFSDKDV